MSAVDDIVQTLVASVRVQAERWLQDILEAQKCSIDDLELVQRPDGLNLVYLRGTVKEVGRMQVRLPQ